MEKIKELLPSVIKNLQTPEWNNRQKITKEWKAIAGPKIAPYTKPSLSDDGKLTVWVNKATLAFEINQRYKATLLKRVQAAIGEETVKKIYVRVGQLR